MHMYIYSHVSVSQIHCVQHRVLIAAPFYQFPLDHRKYVCLLGCKSKFHILRGSNWIIFSVNIFFSRIRDSNITGSELHGRKQTEGSQNNF